MSQVKFESILLKQGLLDNVLLGKIRLSCSNKGLSLFEHLLQHQKLDTDKLYQTAALAWSVPYKKLDSNELEVAHYTKLPLNKLFELTALPLIAADNVLHIAIGNPENLKLLDQLQFYIKQRFTPILSNLHDIKQCLSQFTPNKTHQQSTIESEFSDRLINAANQNASDIHIEPFATYCRVRIRVDGILHPLESISTEQGKRLIAQIKLAANMDIALSHLPQDGQINFKISESSIPLRVNTLPTIHGEKIVLRLLEQHRQRHKLDQLGLFADQHQLIRKILKQPNGLILVTGPTGSGKTVTLYSLIELLNTGAENISTIEDPVEIHEEGIIQININRKAGLDFAQALRALLRQDPDILMIGEIRDTETAQIAVKAAQTGHLVMATLHTRDAANARTRLLQLGVNQHALEEALKLTIAQRLLRRLCLVCKQSIKPAGTLLTQMQALRIDPNPAIARAVGCSQCMQGYSGRSGVFELLYSTSNQLDLKPPESQSLAHSGLLKINQGQTSYQELLRVL